jgi:hypothetical protein
MENTQIALGTIAGLAFTAVIAILLLPGTKAGKRKARHTALMANQPATASFTGWLERLKRDIDREIKT